MLAVRRQGITLLVSSLRHALTPALARVGLGSVASVSIALVAMGTIGMGAAGADTAPTSLSTIVIPDLGPGYVVSSQGPLNPSQFAADAPDPSAASAAFATLGDMISTYERQWQANGGLNQVQDLVVRFPTTTGAQVFLQAAQHSLQSGEIVSKGRLPSIPGARVVTYFAATNESGVGEAITMRVGIYVALLSFFSAAAGNTRPITPADAEKVALAQHTSLVAAPGGHKGSTVARSSASTSSAAPSNKKAASSGDIGWAILVVVVIAAAVATPLVLRRRRQRDDGPLVGGPAGPGGPATQL